MALPIMETPKYSVTIPSSKESVVYRPYLVKEEKVLMIALESENQDQILRAVKEIISTCTFNKVKVEELSLFDLEFVFLKLRSKSVGEISKIGIKCNSCETVNEIEIDLDGVQVKFPEEDLSNVMLTDTVGVKLKYPTVDSAVKLSKFTGVELAMATIVSCIDSIYDENKVYPAKDSTPKELQDFVDSLSSEQFKKLQKFFEKMPSISHDAHFDCSNCSTLNEIEIKGLSNFFG